MYKVGDKVVHQREGACYITRTINMDVENTQKQYFVLEPILNKKSNIYISFDGQKQTSIRPVINQKELTESENKIQVSVPEWVMDAKARYRLFMNAVSAFNFQEVLDIYICLIKQNEIKALAAKDKEFLISSEKLIGSEIAILLDQNYEYVLQKIKKQILS